jgi:pyroglutamyl-peptidase
MMSFVVTGFGRFQGVDKNPTTELVPALVERLKSQGIEVVDSAVLEVSAIEALRFFRKHEQSPNKATVFLHLGVASNRSVLSLERCAFNDADFRCPDERGWTPK